MLELKVKDIDTVVGSPRPEFIYVQGGQSGSLRLDCRKLPQTIKCSRDGHLKLLLCGKNSSAVPMNNDVISEPDFWAAPIIQNNREHLMHEGGGRPIDYIIDYFNTKHEKLGSIIFQVRHIRGLMYQGQLQSAQRLTTRKLPFYKSRCPTYNLYNCLDTGNQHSNFNLIEDIYRDE